MQKYFNWHDGFVTEAHMAEYFRNSNARVVLDLAFTQNLPMDEVRDQHDYSFATERAYPDVILGHWIHLDPFKPESIGELRRCIDKRVGFVGMHINSTPPATDLLALVPRHIFDNVSMELAHPNIADERTPSRVNDK